MCIPWSEDWERQKCCKSKLLHLSFSISWCVIKQVLEIPILTFANNAREPHDLVRQALRPAANVFQLTLLIPQRL
jgi:hypothetical protein